MDGGRKQKKNQSAAWFALANDYKKASYEAARDYYSAQFESDQKRISALEKRVPIASPFSDERDLLESLFHLQGLRAGTLDNLARNQYDYAALLQWGQQQVDTHRRAAPYKQHDYKDFDLAKPENDWARKALWQEPISIANGLESVAEAQSNLGRFDDAEKTLLQALELRQSVPADYVQRYPDIPLRQLGSLFKTLGDYPRAHDYYQQALRVIDDSMPARQARRNAESDAAFRELLLVETAQTRATLLNNLSLVEGDLGDFQGAQRNLNLSLAEMDALPDSPRARAIVLWQRATALGNRGVLHIDVGEVEKGLADLEESIKLWREQGYGDRAGIALINTASIYGERGQDEESQHRIATARQLFTLSQNLSGLMWVNQLASIQAREAGQFEEAATRAEDALNLARQVGNIDYQAMALRTLGAARVKQNRLPEAATLLNDALKLDERSGAPHSMARTLFWQGEMLTAQGHNDQALVKYQRATELIESIRATTQSANAYAENSYIFEVYQSIVSLLIKMGRPAEAFDYLGRSKSKKLQDSLRLTNLKSGDATLQAQLDRAAALQLRLEALDKAIEGENALPDEQKSAQKSAALQEKRLATKQELATIAAQIKKARPGLGATIETSAPSAPSLSDVQKQIPANVALVQWAPVGSEFYAFIVTQNKVDVQTLPTPAADIWNRVREFRNLLDQARRQVQRGQKISVENWLSDDAEIKPLRENLLALRQMLIAPIEAKIADKDTVIFVPNGELYYLPLHALAKRDGNTLKFFGQEKRVAYLAAADVLSVLQKKPSRGSGLMALGDPTGADLPAANEEAKALSNIFPASQIYTGAQATKSNVIAPQNEKRRIWHLATHGVLNATRPELSYILLAPGAQKGDEALTVGEVYGLDLKDTDLVTLSACQTAIGEKNPDGLEITSLATSFARAGADSVIASLWSVSDDSTRDFMVEFYKRLAAGDSKAAAMQKAQAKLLANPHYNHPFYWAPFILMGDWR